MGHARAWRARGPLSYQMSMVHGFYNGQMGWCPHVPSCSRVKWGLVPYSTTPVGIPNRRATGYPAAAHLPHDPSRPRLQPIWVMGDDSQQRHPSPHHLFDFKLEFACDRTSVARRHCRGKRDRGPSGLQPLDSLMLDIGGVPRIATAESSASPPQSKRTSRAVERLKRVRGPVHDGCAIQVKYKSHGGGGGTQPSSHPATQPIRDAKDVGSKSAPCLSPATSLSCWAGLLSGMCVRRGGAVRVKMRGC
jgi:hypothetical protein